MNFKQYMARRFDGCRLIAHSFDEHRKREVQIFHIPGHFDDVGVFDGVDAWVAPVAADPFRANIKRILQAIRDGQPIDANNPPVKRRKIVVEEQAEREPVPEAAVVDDQPRRRRVIVQA